MTIVNEYDTAFGHRSGLLLIGNDNNELTNINFKKAVSSSNNALVVHQKIRASELTVVSLIIIT